MTSLDSQPFSSLAVISALITADCFRSGGYLAISRSIFFSESTESIRTQKQGQTTFFWGDKPPLAPSLPSCQGGEKTWSVPDFSPVDFSEHDVLRADDRHRVGDHVAARHLVERSEVGEAGRTNLQPLRLVRAFRDQVYAELALRRLDRGVHLAFRHVHALGDQLEVMDQLLHALFHLEARRRRDLVVVDHHGARVLAQPVDALTHDAVRLAHLLDAHQVAVVAVPALADRDVELHAVVDLVGLFFPQIPGHARAAQHRAGEAEGESPLCGDHADAYGALLPDAIVREQRLVVIHVPGKAPREILYEVEHGALAVIVQFVNCS